MRPKTLIQIMLIVLLLIPFNAFGVPPDSHIGVLYVIHGGMDTFKPQYMWDASVMQFAFDPNHAVYKFVIWNPEMWPAVLDTNVSEFALRFMRMYDFSYDRIGGTDPNQSLSDKQFADMKAQLDKKGRLYGIEFEVDWAGFLPADRIDHWPYPRFIYYGPDGPGVGYNVTYCGEGEPDGPWPDCDPERYNVDGPVERLLKKGISRIIVVDTHVGGVRYSKGYDVVNKMARRVLDEWNTEHGTSIPLLWINDYSSLMERSYPTEPAGWTATRGYPTKDSHVLLNGSPNPFASDPELATLYVEALEAGMSATVSDADTGIMLLNHALYDNKEVFDPKINDTLVLSKNIKSQLLLRHPTMNPDNIIGGYLGIREVNPENGLLEDTWEMRGEHFGYAWLYESNKLMPGAEWGYRCWDALEYLKNRGVKHIVIGNPQVCTASVLDMIEMPNQIAREIGIKTWAKWETKDYTKYPEVGHPFADYWAIWVNTDCGEWDLNYNSGTSEFNMGATLTGQSSGATGVIKWLHGDAVSGTLTLKEVSGSFQEDELITDDMGGTAHADGSAIMTSKPECCFEMGGCDDPLRSYPPPRQAPLNQERSELDPSLVYDQSDYGHLGYDPAWGAPDPNGPVQDQYTGTWSMYTPPSDDPRVGKLLAKHVLNAAINPMVYITNGELKSIGVGESVTFEAHVIGGKPGYTYRWSIKREEGYWLPVGEDSSTWTWTPKNKKGGMYFIRCKVRDAQKHSGEVTWEGFVVLPEE